jgi:tetratricopeptide (TPR) repeat protein
LIKSGDKNLARYSVNEAHRYFQAAFDLLISKEDRTSAENTILADVLNSWGYSFYYMGDIRGLLELFNKYEKLVQSLNDNSRLGMFCAWLGISYYMAGEPLQAYDYLLKAITLGEKSRDSKVIGYACSWMAWTCAELCRLDEGIKFGNRALEISKDFPADQYLFFKPLAGQTICHFYLGNAEKAIEYGEKLVEYGEKYSNSRSISIGYLVSSFGNLARGDMQKAIADGLKSKELSRDPFYSKFGAMPMGAAYVLDDQNHEAIALLKTYIEYYELYRLGQLSVFCKLFYGVALIAVGEMKIGLNYIQEARKNFEENGRIGMEAISGLVLGSVYAQMAYGPKPPLSILYRNTGFLVTHIPFAKKRAIEYLTLSIEKFKKLSMQSFMGQAHLELGLYYISQNKKEEAIENLDNAINAFEICKADVFLAKTIEALDSIK